MVFTQNLELHRLRLHKGIVLEGSSDVLFPNSFRPIAPPKKFTETKRYLKSSFELFESNNFDSEYICQPSRAERKKVLREHQDIVRSVIQHIKQQIEREITTLKLIKVHGFTEGGRFKAICGQYGLFRQHVDLQRWVEENDGRFDALAILCCNSPRRVKLRSKKSVLYYPIRRVYDSDLIGGTRYNLFDPSNPN